MKKRKDGLYCSQIYLGTNSGKKQYKHVYAHTEKDLRRKVNEIKARAFAGERIPAGDRPFSWWADAFIEFKTETDLSPCYASGLRGKVDFWKSAIGDIPIAKVEVSDIQRGILAQKGKAKKTLTDYKNAASAVFTYAMRERAITYNPAQFADIPKSAGKDERFSLTDEEISWLWDIDHRFCPLALFMLYTGVRRGELLALQVRDIDLSGKTVFVNKSVYYDGDTPHCKRGGKTSAATREIPLPPILVEYLRNYLAGRSPLELAFPGFDGRYMHEAAFRRGWESLLTDLNVKYGQGSEKRSKYDPRGVPFTIRRFTAHCLRHTYATKLHAAGVDVLTAQKLLGHADIKTTLGIYTHLDAEIKARDIELLNSYFSTAK